MKEGWTQVCLKDIAQTQYGYTSSATSNNTGVKFLRITDIVPEFINWENVPFCEISEKDRAKYLLRKGDIVIARTGATVGYAKLISKNNIDSVFASYLVKLTIKDSIDKAFLGKIIEAPIYKEYIQTIAGGAAQPNANANDLTSFKIEIPKDINHQKRIASILSAYDDLIEVNNKRIELLERSARELYKEWFVRMRFPNYQNTKFNKGIPEGWEVENIGKSIPFQIGGGWGEDKKSAIYEIPAYVIRGTDIPKAKFGIPNKDIYRFHKQSNVKSRELIEGDIIFEAAGGSEGQLLGRTCYITNELLNTYGEKVIPASFCKLIRPENNCSLYLYYFLNYLYETGLIETFQLQSTGISNYQFEPFLKFQEIIIPKENLLLEFENKVLPIQREIALIGKQNQELTEIRNRLLPRLISGKLEVKA